ncbi:MAG: hypothetical protein Q9160_000391 [Pyrenula sp. 1 TL-2023]
MPTIAPQNGEESGSVPSVDNKLALLEKRFSELEKKYLELQKETLKEENKPKEPESEKEVKDATNNSERDSKANGSTESEPRVRAVTSRIDPKTSERKDFDSEQAIPDPSVPKKFDYVSLLRRTISEHGANYGDIEIYTSGLRNILQRLLRHYPYHYFMGDTVKIPSPYEPLILNWDTLWEESGKEDTDEKEKQARSDLRELLEKLLSGSGSAQLDSYMQARDSLQRQNTITFDALWTIFPPGSMVYGRLFLRSHQIFIVEDNLTPWPRDDRSRRSTAPLVWKLNCWTYDFTGKEFRRRVVTLRFEEFEGTKPISSLPYYPLEAHKDRKEIEAQLLARGKLFKTYCTADEDERMYNYNGEAVFDKKGFRDVQASRNEGDSYIPDYASQMKYSQVNSDVMVDFDSYYKYGLAVSQIGSTTVDEEIYDCQCPECSSNKTLQERFKPHYDGMKGAEGEEWDNLQFMLCPPRVLGYALKDKQWAQLSVEKLEKIPEKNFQDVMKGLHLGGEDNGAERKNLLLGLVKNHGRGQAKRGNKGYELNDIVAEKGKGLVILLYGTPGVGKTSTGMKFLVFALLKMSNDFGSPNDRHRSQKATILNRSGGCGRTLGTFGPSAEGSALVSVFLRVLEYYRGILFLTTNQIAQFDVAVQSRIHIALKYEELSKEQAKAIFLGFVQQYRNQNVVSEYAKIEKFAEKELHRKKFDGRQIRNIVASAMGYAQGEDEKMNVEHIQQIVSHVEDFKNDLAGQMMKWQDMQKGTRMG